ncbi:Hemolysin-type calcium-binding repeat-containing protein [Syntrophus gentianae]|uniref:Hemolysin-type calcium-binding repeat-containing protein n=1 Tax=Syntrophus gentianae TaxID=43775 RepID=A0A1H7Y7L4_9BACT|nr:calcium-binding protein [Syntrophus gentianae]SEM41925.1 Hemolysin-type calcium-binding repeat-containing protein [Syntrophus gentianae]
MSNVYGNSLSNKLYGTANGDLIYGYGGDDTLYGYAGNDTLDGGTGDDILYGEDGTDILKGGAGKDSLYGGAGNDTLNGGTGKDYMYGGLGNDTYTVDDSSDVVGESESSGTDRVNAYASYTLSANVEKLYLYGTATDGTGNILNNTIAGTSNANTLSGLAGNDTLYGYAGDDTLDGGSGNDTLDGGAGNDTYIVDSTVDVVSEAENAGTDRIDAYISYTLGANVENLYLYDSLATKGTGNALDNVIVGNRSYTEYSLYGLAGNDTLYGNNDNNTLDGGTGNDTLYGGYGNDTYIVDSAGDLAVEDNNSGTDRVNASVNYTLSANVENLYLYGTATKGNGNALGNVIYGTDSNNTLSGLEGNDTLYGYAGNDTLSGGTERDYMYGGLGNDTYIVENSSDVVGETAGYGTDRVKAYLNYTLSDNVENLYLYGTATEGTGNILNNLIAGTSNADTLSGLAGNDKLYGYAGNDTLDGGAGNDTLYGGAGNDTYIVDSAADTIVETADAGTDTVNAYVSYTLPDNVENLNLYGTATVGTGNALDNVIESQQTYSKNTLYGLAGNDTLYGTSDNDILNGGTGNDSMYGGSGSDTYTVDSIDDLVVESDHPGTDVVNAYVSFTLDTDVENLYLYGTAITGTGNDSANNIYGNDSNNILYGLEGNDLLDGGAGVDTLYGGDGGDTLYGGAGNDVLAGGADEDDLTGGAGQDRFVFSEVAYYNYDSITDFSHADDTIVLKDILDSATDSSIRGLSFTNNVLNAGSYFEGYGYTGNGTTDACGIYVNTNSGGTICYNPTSNVGGDSVLICSVGTAASSLDYTDFAYSA